MRIEDGIFTLMATTTGPIDKMYHLNHGTRKATTTDIALSGGLMPGTYGTDNKPVSGLNDDIFTCANPGVSCKVYTNNIGSTEGQIVKFKKLDGETIEVTVFAGMMLPIASIGCDTAGLTVFA